MKILMAVVILVLAGAYLSADTLVAKFEGYSWNTFINNLVKENLELRYQEEAEKFYLVVPDKQTPTEITITEEYRSALYDIIKKYERKERQATSWEEEYDLQLGVLPTTDSRFYKGSFWYDARVNTAANFFSQSIELHQFILFFSEMPALDNKVVVRPAFSYYFWSEDVKNLKKIFSKSTFDKFTKKEKE